MRRTTRRRERSRVAEKKGEIITWSWDTCQVAEGSFEFSDFLTWKYESLGHGTSFSQAAVSKRSS